MLIRNAECGYIKIKCTNYVFWWDCVWYFKFVDQNVQLQENFDIDMSLFWKQKSLLKSKLTNGHNSWLFLWEYSTFITVENTTTFSVSQNKNVQIVLKEIENYWLVFFVFKRFRRFVEMTNKNVLPIEVQSRYFGKWASTFEDILLRSLNGNNNKLRQLMLEVYILRIKDIVS